MPKIPILQSLTTGYESTSYPLPRPDQRPHLPHPHAHAHAQAQPQAQEVATSSTAYWARQRPSHPRDPPESYATPLLHATQLQEASPPATAVSGSSSTASVWGQSSTGASGGGFAPRAPPRRASGYEQQYVYEQPSGEVTTFLHSYHHPAGEAGEPQGQAQSQPQSRGHLQTPLPQMHTTPTPTLTHTPLHQHAHGHGHTHTHGNGSGSGSQHEHYHTPMSMTAAYTPLQSHTALGLSSPGSSRPSSSTLPSTGLSGTGAGMGAGAGAGVQAHQGYYDTPLAQFPNTWMHRQPSNSGSGMGMVSRESGPSTYAQPVHEGGYQGYGLGAGDGGEGGEGGVDGESERDEDEEEEEGVKGRVGRGTGKGKDKGKGKGKGKAEKKPARKHSCVVCDKRFGRPSALTTHMNSHTGQRPYICHWPGCGRDFSVHSNCRRHVRVVHEKSHGLREARERKEAEEAMRAVGAYYPGGQPPPSQHHQQQTGAAATVTAGHGGRYAPYALPHASHAPSSAAVHSRTQAPSAAPAHASAHAHGGSAPARGTSPYPADRTPSHAPSAYPHPHPQPQPQPQRSAYQPSPSPFAYPVPTPGLTYTTAPAPTPSAAYPSTYAAPPAPPAPPPASTSTSAPAPTHASVSTSAAPYPTLQGIGIPRLPEWTPPSMPGDPAMTVEYLRGLEPGATRSRGGGNARDRRGGAQGAERAERGREGRGYGYQY
ncbi:hypothetical protein IAT38_003310 [Cryptococcus sp. DSM 104549]